MLGRLFRLSYGVGICLVTTGYVSGKLIFMLLGGLMLGIGTGGWKD